MNVTPCCSTNAGESSSLYNASFYAVTNRLALYWWVSQEGVEAVQLSIFLLLYYYKSKYEA